MNKIFFFFIIISTSLFSGCGRSTKKIYSEPGVDKNFEVYGTIANGSGKKIFLQIISTDRKQAEDSAVIDSKGDFKLQSVTNYPNLYMLRTESGPFLTLCLKGGEKIRVNADFNDYSDYSISGSEESEQIRELGQKTKEVLSRINELVQISKDSADSPNFSSIKTKLSGEFDILMKNLRTYSYDFIKKNSNSLVCLLALKNQIGPQKSILHPLYDKALFLQVDSVLTSIYPKSELVISFHDELTTFISQIEASKPSQSFLSPGQSAPDISLPSPEGKIIKLSSLRGKYVLLDFWAAWCQPCRAENPNLVLNYQKFHSKGFEIYQVSLDRTKEDWLKGIKDDNLNWLHVSDLKYWNSAVVPLYGIQGIPANYLLDKEGKIIADNLRGPALSEKLAEIFDKK